MSVPVFVRPWVLRVLAALATAALATRPGAAQSGEGWNGDRALDLVRRARALRQATVVDSTFHSYQADARGYVYFFIDRPGSDERTLVKADQVALELFWQAPNHTRQRIVGLRDRKVLPTNIHYHLDHLTVVQDDFADFIRLGDGDEVGAVLHPVGPHSEAFYDFRLADSLSIRYGGGTEEVRVYEIQVRPKDPDKPAFLGSVFLDRATAAIVRMSFTFTPSSYVDPHLDYIRISLDNSLWMGRYWLPYRQEAELRRELPELDFLVGSIIRGRFEIGGYRFNPPIPTMFFQGPRVTALPRARREAFPFERGLFDDLEQEGLAPSPTLEEIRARALEVARGHYLSGLSRNRLHWASFSDGLRYNRAEGLFLGAGVAVRPSSDVTVRAQGGYALGRRGFSGTVTAEGGPSRIVPTLEVEWDETRDLGPHPGSARAVSTLGSLFFGEDFLDPYYVRGLRLRFQRPEPDRSPVSVTLRWERHRSARDVVSDDPAHPSFRPVRRVEEGVLGAIDVSTRRALPAGGEGLLTGTWGRFETRTFGTLRGEATWAREGFLRRADGRLDIAAGVTSAGTPDQALFLLGGRGTLPGHGYRSLVGDRYWLVRGEVTHPLLRPWVGMRAFTAVGGTHLSRHAPPTGWGARDSGGVRASVGLGVSLGWDVLRLDLSRGIRGGDWEFSFSVDSRFHTWL